MSKRSRVFNGLLALLLVLQALSFPLSASATLPDFIGWYARFYGPPQVWDEEDQRDTRGTLNAIDSAGPNDVLAVGMRTDTTPTVFTSSWYARWDGSVWTSETIPGATQELNGLHVLDATHAWAVGAEGIVLFWDGSGWTRYGVGDSSTLRDVVFTDTLNGWAVGSGGVYATTNGGVSWTGVYGYDLNSVEVVGSRLLAVGNGGRVVRKEGATWSAGIATTKPLVGVDMLDGGLAWAVGDDNTFLRSTDWGATWTALTAPIPSGFNATDMDPNSVEFLDARNGVAVGGDYGLAWRTTDGGTNWRATNGLNGEAPYAYLDLRGVSMVPQAPSSEQILWTAGTDPTEPAVRTKAYVFQGYWWTSAPASPAGLSVSAGAPAPRAVLSWTDNASDETTYVVQRAADTTASASFSTVASLSADATSYVDASVDYAHRWYYRVRCVNHAGASNWAGPADILIPDSTSPTTTSNVSAGWYTATPVEISLSATDTGSGVASTERRFGDVGSWTPYTTTFTVSAEGVTPLYFRSTDFAGNREPTKTASVKIDTTAPVTYDDAAASYYGTATVNLTPTDTGSGPAVTRWRIDTGAARTGVVATTSVAGTHTLQYGTTDVAGNREVTKTVEFNVVPPDIQAPVTTSNMDTKWRRSFDVTFTVTDDRAGPLTTYYRLDGAAEATYVTPVTVNTEAVHDIAYRSRDAAGNYENVKNGQVRIDRTPPVTDHDVWPSYVMAATIHLTPTDSGGSSVERTTWRLDSQAPATGTVISTSVLGTHTIQFASTDFAGNVETSQSYTFRVEHSDTAPPVTTTNIDAVWHRSFEVTMSAADNTVGPLATYYSLDGGAEQPYAPFIVDTDGIHDVAYYSVDSVPNTETVKHQGVKIDRVAPTTTVDVAEDASFTGTATVRLTPDDEASGVETTQWRLDAGPVNASSLIATTSVVGTHALEYSSTDVAGNREATKTAHFEVVTAQLSREMTRVAGADRYAVAANLAKVPFPGYKGVEHVIVASGLDAAAADPLAAAGLAGAYNAPILLVDGRPTTTRLPKPTSDALGRMVAANPDTEIKVHVVGGTGSVPAKIMALMHNMDRVTATDRISGSDRYAVGVNIAKRMRELDPAYPRSCLVTNGENPAYFFNALAASPIAARKRFPIFLTRPTTVSSAVKSATTYYDSVYVVGSTTAVSEAVRKGLGATRIGNSSSRYGVASSLAASATAVGNDWLDNTHLAVANKLPDALTGGSAMGLLGGPLLFTDGTKILNSTTRGYLQARASEVRRAYVLGGTGSVTSTTYGQISTALQMP